MKVVAINGSPRKGWNTHMLLEKALDGARACHADTALFHLYDLSFKGCTSCFACKRKNGAAKVCAMTDELLPILHQIASCDVLLIGSPIYFGTVTGEVRSLIERLCFPYISYDNQPTSFGRKINTALLYTMNCPESALDKIGYTQRFASDQALMQRIFGHSELLLSTETLQFSDYGHYAAAMIDEAHQKERRDSVFPLECESAYEMGRRLASGV